MAHRIKAEVDISQRIVRFETDLETLLKISQILKTYLRRSHRRKLKDLLNEISKIYKKIVNAINAFVKIPFNDPNFAESFANNYAKFDKQYKLDKKSVGYHCDFVKEKLEQLTKPRLIGRITSKLTKGQSQKEYLESLRRLKTHINQWYVSDRDVYYTLEQLQINLLEGLTEINNILRRSGPRIADKQLQGFLTKTQTEFDKFKDLYAKLDQLSSQL